MNSQQSKRSQKILMEEIEKIKRGYPNEWKYAMPFKERCRLESALPDPMDPYITESLFTKIMHYIFKCC